MKKLCCLAITGMLLSSLMVINANGIPARDNQTKAQDMYPDKEPLSADAYHAQGVLYLTKKMLQEANEQFREALKLDPNHLKSLIGLLSTSLLIGNLDDAKESARKALSIQPDSPVLWNVIGESWMIAGSPGNVAEVVRKEYAAEAETKFKKAISLDPKFIPAYLNLGKLYISIDRFDEGIKEYRNAIKLQPDNPEIRRQLAYIYLNSGLIDKGLEEAREMVRVSPGSPVYRNGLGEIYINERRLDEAMAEFQEAIKLNPEYTKAYVNIGRVHVMRREADKAIEEFSKALSLSPNYGDAYAGLGTAYLVKAMNQKAIEEYEKAISEKSIETVSPLNLVNIYNNLAYLYSEGLEELDTALSYAVRAKGAAPGEPNVADTLGWIYYKKGLYDEAVENLKVAVEGSPDNPSIRYHLGAAYYKKGLRDEAIAELRQSLSINNEFPDADEVKRLLEELGSR